MLGVFFLSLIGALFCTALCVIIGFIMHKIEFKKRIIECIFCFFIEFGWLAIFLYYSCKPQTILTVAMWIWPGVLLSLIFLGIFGNNPFTNNNVTRSESYSLFGLLLISLFLCISQLFAPVQNLLYVHDMENVDVTYTISSEEIFAKIDLTIVDRDTWKNKYSIDSPEMRKINEKNVAVYHIKNIDTTENRTEYIPGFAIQEEGTLPTIISKRMYFDKSYVNKKDALRTVRRTYPTIILGESKFDVDDECNPYQVFEYRENLFFSNGNDYGIVILNLRDGTCQKYPISKIPSWVDFKTTYPR